jgi:histone H3/H4
VGQTAAVGDVQVAGEFDAGAVALQRIREEQKSTEPILDAERFGPFALAQLGGLLGSGGETTGVPPVVIISSTSLAVLRLALEERLVDLLKCAQLAAVHARWACVRPVDLRHVFRTKDTRMPTTRLQRFAAHGFKGLNSYSHYIGFAVFIIMGSAL